MSTEQTERRETRRIGRLSTRADRATISLPGALPTDVQTDSLSRLRVILIALAISCVIAVVIRRVAIAQGVAITPSALIFGDIIFGLMLVCALGLIYGSRRDRLPVRTVLALALAFEVFGMFMLVSLERMMFNFGEQPTRVSMAVIPTMAFAATVPVGMRARYITTGLLLLAVPASLALTSAVLDRPLRDWNNTALALAPTMLSILLSLVVWRTVYRLGLKVKSARQLGKYELVDLLGAGGMGEVWRAKHRHLVRPAAVKLIRPEKLATMRDSARRFQREAQATSVLRSPHTVELYDFGVSPDGVFYYVMELLEGIDLDRFVKQFGPMPSNRAVFVLRQICRSLAEAHDCGLIHRDIKPANISLCCMGAEYDFVKVLDFGLVKPRADARDEPELTGADTLLGTPAFMPPEFILEDPVDARSDLYSLGCVAYWLLTGRLVFSGKTAIKVAMAHVHDQPVPPSAMTSAPIPADLEAIVLACLAKSPDDRPASAEALYDLLGDCPIETPWTERTARAWWHENESDEPPHAADVDVHAVTLGMGDTVQTDTAEPG